MLNKRSHTHARKDAMTDPKELLREHKVGFRLGVSRITTMMVYLGGQLLKEQYSTTILHYLPFTLVCLKFRTYLLATEASVPPS